MHSPPSRTTRRQHFWCWKRSHSSKEDDPRNNRASCVREHSSHRNRAGSCSFDLGAVVVEKVLIDNNKFGKYWGTQIRQRFKKKEIFRFVENILLVDKAHGIDSQVTRDHTWPRYAETRDHCVTSRGWRQFKSSLRA